MKSLTLIIVTAVFVISLAANMWMLNERWQVKFYQKGLLDGATQIRNKIVQEVQKTGQLKVALGNGKGVVLTAQKAKQPLPVPPVNLRPVIQSQDPNGIKK